MKEQVRWLHRKRTEGGKKEEMGNRDRKIPEVSIERMTSPESSSHLPGMHRPQMETLNGFIRRIDFRPMMADSDHERGSFSHI